jgi:hypothetical protein
MSPRPIRRHAIRIPDFRGFSAILIKRRIASGRDSGSLCPDNQSSTAASSSGGSLIPICGARLPSPLSERRAASFFY